MQGCSRTAPSLGIARALWTSTSTNNGSLTEVATRRITTVCNRLGTRIESHVACPADARRILRPLCRSHSIACSSQISIHAILSLVAKPYSVVLSLLTDIEIAKDGLPRVVNTSRYGTRRRIRSEILHMHLPHTEPVSLCHGMLLR